jgi:pimeloyl-ACP methyl ester carboxylesterase
VGGGDEARCGELQEREHWLQMEVPRDPALATAASAAASSSGDAVRVRVRALEVSPLPAAAAAAARAHARAPPPFLLLHGFLGEAGDWAALARGLAAAGHRCVALDLPGHGGTRPLAAAEEEEKEGGAARAPSWGPYSIPGAAALATAAARQLGLEVGRHARATATNRQ